MTYFKDYSTEALINAGSPQSKLNPEQWKALLHELTDRKQRIEDELIRMGIPANIFLDPYSKGQLKNKITILGKIDGIIR
jgi:hypothetical protein